MTGKVRIISGNWRGRKLDVPNVPGLRPTGDRLRETLFNWLQGRIAGRRCLDLFAGTGALGLEAASRGAQSVTLVEINPQLCGALSEIGRHWPDGNRVQVVNQDVSHFLAQTPVEQGLQAFDCVFVDPPFDAGLQGLCLRLLQQNEWLNRQAWVYVESAAGDNHFELNRWQIQRDKRIGEVRMLLLEPAALAPLDR
ncbi:MAG: 16S rRNA (guanine(966)-N(2))-methyltransferase RsmD [Pseudomonadota bacterium]